MKRVDSVYATDQEREIARIIRDHPALHQHLTLLLNGYRELVQVSLAGADRSDVQRDLLKKEASMQRVGIPLLETPQDWERERMRKETPHGIAYRARTPEQKREVIERLLAIWEQHPDLRLGQLITNVYRDCYYVEDLDFIDALEWFYSSIGGNDVREETSPVAEEKID